MAGLVGTREAPDPLQRCVGREPEGLVQQQDAVHDSVRLAVQVCGDGAVDELGEVGRLVQGVVEHEGQARCVPQAQFAAHRAAQEPSGMRQPACHLLRIVAAGKGHEEDPRGGQILRHLHLRDGDVADARILDLTADEVGEHTLHLCLDPAVTAPGLLVLAGHFA